jgi:hypothetical protein
LRTSAATSEGTNKDEEDQTCASPYTPIDVNLMESQPSGSSQKGVAGITFSALEYIRSLLA